MQKKRVQSMASLSSSASSSLGPVGFVGVGIMGEGMAMNLLKGGKTLILWNRSKAKCDPLTSAYPDTCVVVDTPQEVVAKCATTFCMLSTLEEIALHQLDIDKIECLNHCRCLKIVYLQGNLIRKIENLDHFSKLRCLFVNRNFKPLRNQSVSGE